MPPKNKEKHQNPGLSRIPTVELLLDTMRAVGQDDATRVDMD
jgi:hypothetical protein